MGLDDVDFAITVERSDGSEVSVPLDFDFSDVTHRELGEMAELDLSQLGEVTDEQALAAGLMFVRLRRRVPEASWDGFAPFVTGLFDAESSVVEVR